MSEHRYTSHVLYADYGRAACGLGLCLLPLVLLEPAPVVAAVLGALALLFAWFGARTGLRQASRIELSGEAIALRGPLPKRLSWAQVRKVKLAYFAPRRARQQGWLQLTLRGPGGPIRIDSTICGFDLILERVQVVVAARELPLDPASTCNFAALGLEPRPGSSTDADPGPALSGAAPGRGGLTTTGRAARLNRPAA